MNRRFYTTEQNEVLDSLCRINWLMARAKQTSSFYSRTQMEVFSLLHATFEQRLEKPDADDVNPHHY